MSTSPESGFSWPVMILNRVDLPAPLGPITPTMPPGGKREGQVLEQQLVAIGLGQAFDLDDLAAEPLGHLDEDFGLARDVLFLRGDELVELGDTRLRLGLAGLRRPAGSTRARP